jgi:hypothetical protein
MEWNQDNQQPNRESGSLATRKSELIHVSNRELAADPAEIHVHHYHVNIANRKIFYGCYIQKRHTTTSGHKYRSNLDQLNCIWITKEPYDPGIVKTLSNNAVYPNRCPKFFHIHFPGKRRNLSHPLVAPTTQNRFRCVWSVRLSSAPKQRMAMYFIGVVIRFCSVKIRRGD